MPLCTLLLVSLLSTQTPLPNGYGAPSASADGTMRLPVTVDQNTIDRCNFVRNDHGAFECSVKNSDSKAATIERAQSFAFEAVQVLPDDNWRRDSGQGVMSVVATPAQITIRVRMQGLVSNGSRDPRVFFDSANDAVLFARQVVASTPGGTIKGDIRISLQR